MDGIDPRIHVTSEHLSRLQSSSGGLSFLPRQAAASVLNGRHRSRLRGRGLDFEEMRNYLHGDDIRAIDWKTTAKTGKPYVRVMTEERDRPALLVVDQRSAMFYGSVMNMKSVTAAEAAAIAAYRIQAQADRVGGLVFNDQGHDTVHPVRGQHGLNALIGKISRYNQALSADGPPANHETFNDVLHQVARIARHNHLVIILSDFDGADERTEQRLGSIAEHNDLILMLVHDPSARNLAPQKPLSVSDGSRQAELNLSDASVAEAVRTFSSKRLDDVFAWQTRINLSVFALNAGEDTLQQIRTLMGSMAPRRRIR